MKRNNKFIVLVFAGMFVAAALVGLDKKGQSANTGDYGAVVESRMLKDEKWCDNEHARLEKLGFRHRSFLRKSNEYRNRCPNGKAVL